MTHELPLLPYARDSLAPFISVETIDYHYGKHHQAYVANLNKLLPGSEFAHSSLEDIVRGASGPIYNNGAQVYNHTFYWHCLKPAGGGAPQGAVGEALAEAFGSFEDFREEFSAKAATLFGSGWVWLVKSENHHLEIIQSANAGNPLRDGLTPVLTCDVWEHAYYIDYRNARPRYLEAFWSLVNWDFVAESLTA